MNPMILMGLVSMVIFIGMPKLVENSMSKTSALLPHQSRRNILLTTDDATVDPETRAEWEATQKDSPMNSILGGGAGGQQAANPLGNFDMAAYLSGSNKKDGSSSPAPSGDSGSKGKSQGVRR